MRRHKYAFLCIPWIQAFLPNSSKLMKTPLLFCFDFYCQIIREYIYIHKYLTVIFSTLRMLRGFLFWLQQFTFLLALRAFLFKPCLHFFFRAIQWLLAPLYTTFPRPLYFGIPFSFWNALSSTNPLPIMSAWTSTHQSRFNSFYLNGKSSQTPRYIYVLLVTSYKPLWVFTSLQTKFWVLRP